MKTGDAPKLTAGTFYTFPVRTPWPIPNYQGQTSAKNKRTAKQKLLGFAFAIGISAVGWYRWPYPAAKNLSRFIMLGLLVGANWLTLWFLSAEVIEGVSRGSVVDVSSSNEASVISLGLTSSLH